MHIWVKIIAKFCFAIMLFVSCDVGNLGGGGGGDDCGAFDRIEVTQIINIKKSPNAVVERDSVRLEAVISDSLVSGFTYHWSDITDSRFAPSWNGSPYSNVVFWRAPEVMQAKHYNFRLEVKNDSLEQDARTSDSGCVIYDYETAEFGFDISVLPSDTTATGSHPI